MEHVSEEQNVSANMVEILNREKCIEKSQSNYEVAAESTAYDTCSKLQDLERFIADEGTALEDALRSSVVSIEREGWLQFHSEMPENPFASETYGEPQQIRQPDLWEQLLDSELHAQSQTENKSFADRETKYKLLEGQDWHGPLASPGNPFIDRLDRLSNFSNADDLDFEEVRNSHSDLHLEPEEEREEHLSALLHDGNAPREDQVATVHVSALETQSVPEIAVSRQKNNQQDGELLSPADEQEAVEVFEAPSFMSLVDPETQEMLNASMPEQVRKNVPPVSHIRINGDGTSGSFKSPACLQNPENKETKWESLVESMRLTQQSSTSPSHIATTNSAPQGVTTLLSSIGTFSKSEKSALSSSSTGPTRASAGKAFFFSWLNFSSSPGKIHMPVLSDSSPSKKKVGQESERVPEAVNKLASLTKKTKENSKSIWATYICCCSK